MPQASSDPTLRPITLHVAAPVATVLKEGEGEAPLARLAQRLGRSIRIVDEPGWERDHALIEEG